MNISLYIMAFISMASFLCCFGPCFSNIGSSITPTLFDLMFGMESHRDNMYIARNAYGGLTFLFSLVIIIVLLGFYLFVMFLAEASKKRLIIVSGLINFFSLHASILAFCSLIITKTYLNATLGFGSILLGVCYLVNVICFFVALLFYYKGNVKKVEYSFESGNKNSNFFINMPLIFMSIISIFGIYACFGEAIIIKKLEIGPTMFDLMFGLKINDNLVYRNNALTVLFVLELIIVIIGFIQIVAFIKKDNIKKKIIIGAISSCFSLTAAVISFCTRSITTYDFEITGLGAGAIIFGIMQIIAILSFIVTLLYYIGNKIKVNRTNTYIDKN